MTWMARLVLRFARVQRLGRRARSASRTRASPAPGERRPARARYAPPVRDPRHDLRPLAANDGEASTGCLKVAPPAWCAVRPCVDRHDDPLLALWHVGDRRCSALAAPPANRLDHQYWISKPAAEDPPAGSTVDPGVHAAGQVGVRCLGCQVENVPQQPRAARAARAASEEVDDTSREASDDRDDEPGTQGAPPTGFVRPRTHS